VSNNSLGMELYLEKKGCLKGDYIKIRLLVWALLSSEWYMYKKGRIRYCQRKIMWGRLRVKTEAKKKTNLAAP
jgi:hypothetical protein